MTGDRLEPARKARSDRSVGRRTLIARTCHACGELLPAARFARTGGYWNKTCMLCKLHRQRSKMPADQRRELQARAYARTQQRSVRGARHGLEWTGAELEVLATHANLSSWDLAAMLGRTPLAVRAQLFRIRHEPHRARLAGTTTDRTVDQIGEDR